MGPPHVGRILGAGILGVGPGQPPTSVPSHVLLCDGSSHLSQPRVLRTGQMGLDAELALQNPAQLCGHPCPLPLPTPHLCMMDTCSFTCGPGSVCSCCFSVVQVSCQVIWRLVGQGWADFPGSSVALRPVLIASHVLPWGPRGWRGRMQSAPCQCQGCAGHAPGNIWPWALPP